jgi:hypothetical protein
MVPPFLPTVAEIFVIISLPVFLADLCLEATCQFSLSRRNHQQLEALIPEGCLLLLVLFQ